MPSRHWRRAPRLRPMATTVGAAVLLAACSGAGGSADPSVPADDRLLGDAASIDAELVADLGEDEAAALATSVNAFGLELHRRLAVAQPDENVVTSPLSVATLMAMLAAGAEGRTAEELVDVLGLEAARDDRFAALLLAVSDTDEVELAVADALWLDDGHELVADYATFVRDVFGATIDTVPLEDQSSADTIDQWVRDRTNERIDGIAEELGLPSEDAVLVLANAVYFLGEWTTQFDPSDTVDAPFTLADGEVVDVPTMQSPADAEFPVRLGAGDGFRVLRLPYGETGRYAMDVLLPDADRDLPTLLDSLDAAGLAAATDDLDEATDVRVALPTFELEWDETLNEVLAAMGIESAFVGGFAPMSPSSPVLGSVVHKTYVRVDEAGTEAAAVTAAVTRLSAAGPRPFLVDRPFAFTVTDTDTGTVLFLGSVTDPRE